MSNQAAITNAFNRREISLTHYILSVRHFSVKFKRGLWAIAIEWPSRNLHDFVQNFLVLSMHIFKVRISFRKAYQIALQ